MEERHLRLASVALKACVCLRLQGTALARIRDSAVRGTDWRASVTKERLVEELRRIPSGLLRLPSGLDRTGDEPRGLRFWNLTEDRISIDYDGTDITKSARSWRESCGVNLERELPHWQHSTNGVPGSTFRIRGCGYPTTFTAGTDSVQIVFVVTKRSGITSV